MSKATLQRQADHRAMWCYCGEPTPGVQYRLTVGDFRRALEAIDAD